VPDRAIQNGDRIVAIDIMTSLHAVYMADIQTDRQTHARLTILRFATEAEHRSKKK